MKHEETEKTGIENYLNFENNMHNIKKKGKIHF